MNRTAILSAAALTVVTAVGSPRATFDQPREPAGQQDWPAVTRETRPWTRWWWHGSAVDRASLTAQLEAMKEAGIGGVEITPIYGVRGAEGRFIEYLSPQWVGMLEHTLGEARRLDLGVDMATGTGWPFGGPWVGEDLAPRSIAHRTWTVGGGERLTERVALEQTPLVRAVGSQVHVVADGAFGENPRAGAAPPPPARPAGRPLQITDLAFPVTANRNLQALALEQVKYPVDLPLATLMAYGDSGTILDLTPRVSLDGALDWVAPPGRWTLYALFAGWHGKLVERAAPGGEGNVIDHFSAQAIDRYLARFDRAFAERRLDGLRAFFNDSYEVDDASGQADWTPRLFDEFQKRRGYDLRRHLPALLGRDGEDANARVLADYRETISDLLLDRFTAGWRSWAQRRQRLVRNQAHGAPGSLLDLYAASDIPETEGVDVQRFKWAASAANVAGRRLVSAEAATWLGEHFRSTLGEVRNAVDRFFIGGVNHIVYHGTAYSPRDEPWPGWQFYAAVEFSPQNAWWDDFGELNRYVSRVQSFLQAGTADHDVLLYYPLYDALATRGNALLAHFGGGGGRGGQPAFDEAARTLQDRGFTYDFISDRQLRATRVAGGALRTGGGSYRVLVLPSSRFIALDTFEHVLSMARAGATVVSLGDWPSDVAGVAGLNGRRERYRRALASLSFAPAKAEGVREARAGAGRILRGDDLSWLLELAGVQRERMVDQGLHFARRVDRQRQIYFVKNAAERPVDGWVPVAARASAIAAFDPISGRSGGARSRVAAGGSREVYLQLPAGASLILVASSAVSPGEYPAYRPAGDAIDIGAPWRLEFVKGGPEMPPSRPLDRLISWTESGGDEVKRFSGTGRYTARFARPAGAAGAWQIDLGRVHESARVRINGRDLGTIIAPPYRVTVNAAMLEANNVLEVSVTNLSANRIADLDRRGVVWKKFYNVNFPARFPQNRGADGLFSAAGWTPLESGLLGPVTLTPLDVIR